MAKHASIPAVENSMNYIKGQKDMRLEDELPRLEDVQYATGEKQRALLIAPERMNWLG